VILAAIIVMAPYFEPLRVEFLGADDPYLDPCVRAVSLPDRSVVVFSDWGSFTGPLAHLVMEDHRSGYERTLKLSRIAIPIGIDRQGSFIIQQPARSEEARILRWGMDGKLSVVARIPAKRSTLIDLRQRAYLELHEGVLSISPGSGKLLIDLLSLAGTGLDLWLVDLRTGHSVIVIPNHARYRWWQTQITWGKDAVFVTGYGAPLRIDLRGTKVTAMPALERVQ
jgi:hypothetical protein